MTERGHEGQRATLDDFPDPLDEQLHAHGLKSLRSRIHGTRPTQWPPRRSTERQGSFAWQLLFELSRFVANFRLRPSKADDSDPIPFCEDRLIRLNPTDSVKLSLLRSCASVPSGSRQDPVRVGVSFSPNIIYFTDHCAVDRLRQPSSSPSTQSAAIQQIL